MKERRAVIVGGGITGLAAARSLHRLAPGTEIVLVERERRLGGKILTERMDGFVVEGGPDSFLASKPRGIGLCRELGLEGRLEGPDEQNRRTYVMCNGQLQRLPEGLTGLVPSRLGPLLRSTFLSSAGKLRAGLELVTPPLQDEADESLAQFVTRRLGRETYDRLVEPLMAGIYAGDGEQLSLAATFPQLRRTEIEHGSLIRGITASRGRARPPPGDGKVRAAFLSPLTGMAEIVEALESQLTDLRLLGTAQVTSVRPTATGYAVRLRGGDTITAGTVLLATPAYATAELVGDFDPDLAALLAAIPYVSTATVSVAYPLRSVPSPLNGYGYIVPRREGKPVLACTWTSSKFPHRAPPGQALIRAFVGRAGQEGIAEAPQRDLLELIRRELHEVLGITDAPSFHRIYRWPDAMPQYTLGHLQRLTAIERRISAHPGLLLAGSAFRGVGIPDCIQSGEIAASRAAELLQAG